VASCFKCNQEIKFSDYHVSERTGKKIPLDAFSEQPHKCIDSEFISQVLKCTHCDSEITFSDEQKSKTGKKIPLDAGNMLPHRCKEGSAAWRATHPPKAIFCWNCKELIKFDDDHVSEGGRHIPVDVVSGNTHNCEKKQR
jgi:hypothetical protein